MKRVLLICYYFPPLGLGGVGRPLQLFRLLPEIGWDCHVLTVKNVSYRAYEPELLDGLDLKKIHRAGSRDPQRLLHLLGIRTVKSSTIARTRAASSRFFPDSKIGWVRPAIKLGRTLFENYHYDCIISTSPPVSSHLIGMQLAQEYSVMWIADFRDYWTVSQIENSYNRESQIQKGERLRQEIREKSDFRSAAHEGVANYISPATVITNGFDSSLAGLWTKKCDATTVSIGLLGHQHQDRMIEPLLATLDALRRRSPDLFDLVRIVQVGDVDRDWFESILSEHGMKEKLEINGRLSRRETILCLNKVSMFYIGLDIPVIPTRFFDMLASGRHIFAYGPEESDLRTAMANCPVGHYYTADSLDQAVDQLEEHIVAAQSGSLALSPLAEYVSQYSSRGMVEKFVSLMESPKSEK